MSTPEVAPVPRAAPPDAVAAPPKPIAIRYLGFQDVDGRRLYTLQAQRGLETCRYTMAIELEAFSKRHALLQDGPDICYQKLRELSVAEMPPDGAVEVTANDLTAYRETHSRAPRRTFSSPAEPSATPAPAPEPDPQ